VGVRTQNHRGEPMNQKKGTYDRAAELAAKKDRTVQETTELDQILERL